MYTFLLSWENSTNMDSTEFCAETKNEVINLFRNFIKENPNTKPIGTVHAETIYDQDDAEEYGDKYFPARRKFIRLLSIEYKTKKKGLTDIWDTKS